MSVRFLVVEAMGKASGGPASMETKELGVADEPKQQPGRGTETWEAGLGPHRLASPSHWASTQLPTQKERKR